MAWAYVYQLSPPQLADRLLTVQQLLDEENAHAQMSGRTWSGRVVVEEQITHILVVSDSPEQDHAGNRKLEAELKGLQATFSLSAPLELP
ncbi:MAG: hypothetical protein ABR537_09415 [Gemmatimonadales bacterium]